MWDPTCLPLLLGLSEDHNMRQGIQIFFLLLIIRYVLPLPLPTTQTSESARSQIPEGEDHEFWSPKRVGLASLEHPIV